MWLQSTVYESAHYAVFLRHPIICILLGGSVLSAIWYQMCAVGFSFFFSLFIVVLLFCCMKYLNGKLGYLAWTIFCCYHCLVVVVVAAEAAAAVAAGGGGGGH